LHNVQVIKKNGQFEKNHTFSKASPCSKADLKTGNFSTSPGDKTCLQGGFVHPEKQLPPATVCHCPIL
jgi:hypothetical protein